MFSRILLTSQKVTGFSFLIKCISGITVDMNEIDDLTVFYFSFFAKQRKRVAIRSESES